MSEDDRVMLLSVIAILVFTITCIIILAVGGCANYFDPLWEFDEIPDLGLQTIPGIMDWVATEIWYVSDSIHYPADEYWQSPAQTYVWRSGDCEDYAILALYLIHRDVGMDGEMWYSRNHAWIFVDGHEWEPQLGVICDGWYEVVQKLPYETVIRRATTSHKRLDRPE